MDGEEERVMDEDESQENSQTEEEIGGPNSQELYSQTPPLPSTLRTEGGSDDEDDKEEEQTSGTVWGHPRYPW